MFEADTPSRQSELAVIQKEGSRHSHPVYYWKVTNALCLATALREIGQRVRWDVHFCLYKTVVLRLSEVEYAVCSIVCSRDLFWTLKCCPNGVLNVHFYNSA